MKGLLRLRRNLASLISRKLIPKKFFIISDDCWGGQLYRQLHIEYLTPTVGLWIHPKDYLNYIEFIKTSGKGNLDFVQSDKDYPVANLEGIEIHFKHYKNEDQAKEKYYRRLGRIQKDKLLVKIDFGKPEYTKLDIKRWNKMQLQNSVAFYPSDPEFQTRHIHNGVMIPDWVSDGSEMFDITRKHFNVFQWIRTGKINSSGLHKIMNVLLFDPRAPKRITHNAMKSIRRKSRAPR